MISELIFLTVSAFSTPLLENSTYEQDNTHCRLTINEERHQNDIVLVFSASSEKQHQVHIYHSIPQESPSSGLLTQLPVNQDESLPNNQYLIEHALYKVVNDDITIYSTAIGSEQNSAQDFMSRFENDGYKTLVAIDGIEINLSFVADHQQALAFYQCAQLASNDYDIPMLSQGALSGTSS
jgi:hypothetical protein